MPANRIARCTHLQNALTLLAALPESSQRNELELQLQHALGNVLIAVKGFGAAETGRAFGRALELCNKFKGAQQTTTVVNGIIGFHLMREEFEQAGILAQSLLAPNARQDDAMKRLLGHRALGMSLFYMGELKAAGQQLHAAIELYDVTPQGPLATVFSQDQKATAQVYLAVTSVLLNDITGGLALGRSAVAYAEQLRHPHTLAYVLAFLAGAYGLSSMPDAVGPVAERAIELSREHGFPLWLAGGRLWRGWAQVELGNADEGLAEIRLSMVALEATGALPWVRFARYLLADALAKTGQLREAAQLLDQALTSLSGTSGRWYEAELHRLRGDVLRGSNDSSSAEGCYERAITIAERQGALLWQLRAANSLAALWHVQGKDLQAHDRLAALCAGLDDNVVSTELQRAKELLAATS